MEVNQLRYVCAIADTGNFSRAAERCHIAQPSLSQQVLKLEEDLGAKLFDRLGRSVRLTEAGRAFVQHARTILEQMEQARSSVANKNAGFRGSVAVGVIPTVAPYLMPRYTAAFTKKFPDAKLRVIEDTTSVLIEGLRDLSLDVAILALPLRHKELELTPIRTEPLFAVLPKDHPRASAKSLALKDLRGESFVMLRDGHCFRDLSIGTCTRAHGGITPHIAFESEQFSSLWAWSQPASASHSFPKWPFPATLAINIKMTATPIAATSVCVTPRPPAHCRRRPPRPLLQPRPARLPLRPRKSSAQSAPLAP